MTNFATERSLARPMGPVTEHTPLCAGTTAEQWPGIAGAPAWLNVSGPSCSPSHGSPSSLRIRCLRPTDHTGSYRSVRRFRDPIRYLRRQHQPVAGILATRLDVPEQLDRELLDLLALGAHTRLDGQAGLRDCICA